MDLQLLSFLAWGWTVSITVRLGPWTVCWKTLKRWLREFPRVRLDTSDKWLINLLPTWRTEPQFFGLYCVCDISERADILSTCISRCESFVLPHMSQLWVCNFDTSTERMNRTLAGSFEQFRTTEFITHINGRCAWVRNANESTGLMGVDRHDL
jgi:hypothetical protein